MDRKKRNLLIAGGGAALALIIAFIALRDTDKNISLFEKLKKNPATRPYSEEAVSRFALKPEHPADSDDELDFEQKIAYLRQRYGNKISSYKVQINLIEALWRHCQKKHPDAWIECVQEFLYAAFPDLAPDIFRLFEKYYRYQTWLSEQKDSFVGLSDTDRKRKLWEKRRALFGQEVADEIWAAEIKNDRVIDTLEKIDRMEDKSVKEKLSIYRKSLDEIYTDRDDKLVERRQQEFMDRFLNLDSVQSQLDVMTPAERKENLREVRKAMGMKSDALARWDELDSVRDQRWSNAEKYYAERDAATKNLKGDALEKKLDELRAKYFGAEGETIKSEEQGGYFRYKEKRKWGQN